jgi:hypothetical protein
VSVWGCSLLFEEVTNSNFERKQNQKAVVTPDDNIIIVDIIVGRDARGALLIAKREIM